MPTAVHPQARFDPIPPDLDLGALVERIPNFKWAQRVSRSQIRNLGPQEFEKLVLIHVIVGGKPLVIDGWDAVLPKSLFSTDWLESTFDKKQENVRDVSAASDIPMTMGHYLRSMKQLANQWTPLNFRDERRQRLYLKDIDCPPEWRKVLQKVIHPNLFYLNENVNTTGADTDKDDAIFQSEVTSGSAGDLMSSLPEEMRAQNLMCYIGHEGTYTPAHREMCASLGQNIMVEASEDGNGEKAGSSIWFMTESKDREVVREYFLSMLGHDIEIEKHFAQVNAWKKAPFDVYVVEQRPGDFILVPPLAAHQVWNRGTRTMKVAWNRTTAETLEMALHEALPKARLVCRDEQYKNKAIIYFTLLKYYEELQTMEEKAEMTQMSFMGLGQDIVRNSPRAKQLASDFKQLFNLFTEVMVDEMFAHKEKDVEFLPFDSCVTCSYCRSNIFNRFLTCKHCVRTLLNGDEDAYDICMECYAMGRSCACLSGLQWCEQWSWPELVQNFETWRSMVIRNEGFVDFENSPQPYEVARRRAGKKSVAQICQEALRRRPWKDITKDSREKTPSESEPENDGDRPKAKPKRKEKKGEVRRCHVCCRKDYRYRVHECTNPDCTEAYCYGVLYRAFDMIPQKVLEDEQWQCPKCLGICNCGHCRRSGNINAYTPKNTSLGHDTRPIADDRSVEALVDFRVHNLSWLKAAGEESRSKDSRRMKRLREQADHAKAQDLTEQNETDHTMQNEQHPGDPNGNMELHANGYGDQSHILDATDVDARHDAHGDPAQMPQEEAFEGDAAEPSPGMIASGEDFDNPLYPDPAILARQRIGMGYYEQDDTPDKILFDPYQAPSVDQITSNEPDVPDFVKKSIRAAKRKARRANEDPDFTMSKSHHKKTRIAPEPEPEPDLLDSMDPALFNEIEVPSETVAEQPDQSQPQVVREQEKPTLADQPESISHKGMKMPRFDANEAILRHAKPRASYVELDDVELDELEEDAAIAGESKTTTETQGGRNRSPPAHGPQDAIGMAADAVRAIFGSSMKGKVVQGEGGTVVGEAGTPGTGHKRRGRPPKHATEGTELSPATPGGPGSRGRGRGRPRGRPRKSFLGRLMQSNDLEMGNEATVDEEIEAQLESMRQQDDAEEQDERPRRGRPRRSGITTIVAATAAAEETDVDAEAADTSSGSLPPSRAELDPSRSGVGRTRRSEGNGTPRLPKTETRKNLQFMSMAERMALKGKKFKIGKRMSQGARASDTPTPSRDTSIVASQPAEGASRQDGSVDGLRDGTGAPDGSIAASPEDPSIQTGSADKTDAVWGRTTRSATVVRLGGAGSEDEGAFGESSSSGEESDNEDIPARGRTSSGRGAVRGGVISKGRLGAGGLELGNAKTERKRIITRVYPPESPHIYPLVHSVAKYSARIAVTAQYGRRSILAPQLPVRRDRHCISTRGNSWPRLINVGSPLTINIVLGCPTPHQTPQAEFERQECMDPASLPRSGRWGTLMPQRARTATPSGTIAVSTAIALGLVVCLVSICTMLLKVLPVSAAAALSRLQWGADAAAAAAAAKWHAPAQTHVNNLTSALTETGVYGFIYDSSHTPDESYGTYNWCNMPHVRRQEYVKPGSEFKLQYVEVIHRHHKRTPYASNGFPVESYHWDCDDSGLYTYGEAFEGPQAAKVYRQGYISSVNPFVPSGWIGTCQFPQITSGGLQDSWQHGADLYGVYHDLLGFLPDREDDHFGAKVIYRATNNLITNQVAGMVINGMWGETQPFPLKIQASGIDSLEPQYSCPAGSELFNSIQSSSSPAWQQHLDRSAALLRVLDDISGVHPDDAGFHDSFDHYYDNLSARQCHGKPLPCKIVNGVNSTTCVTQDLANEVYRLGQWEYSQIHRDNSSSLWAGSATFGVWIGELTTHLRQAMAGESDAVYFHNIAHDGSISRVLSILQLEKMVWPGMGAEVVFELYEKEQAGARRGNSGLPETGTQATRQVTDRSESGHYVRILWGGTVLHSSSPVLGQVDMIPVEALLGYLDDLVGEGANKVMGKCHGDTHAAR